MFTITKNVALAGIVVLLLAGLVTLAITLFGNDARLRKSLTEISGIDLPEDFRVEVDKSDFGQLGADSIRLVVISSPEFVRISEGCKVPGYSRYQPTNEQPIPRWSNTTVGQFVDWERPVCFKEVSPDYSSILAINGNKLIYSYFD